jgi:hypothetical protein
VRASRRTWRQDIAAKEAEIWRRVQLGLCIFCGGMIAPCLARLGSTGCHDCRGEAPRFRLSPLDGSAPRQSSTNGTKALNDYIYNGDNGDPHEHGDGYRERGDDPARDAGRERD